MAKTTLPQLTVQDLIQDLELVNSQGGYNATGLIIRKDNKSASVQDIVKQLSKNVVLDINAKSDDKKLVSELKKAFKAGKWLVIHLSDGSLSPLWREQLMRLRDSNSVFIQGDGVKDTYYAEMSPDMRAVVIISNSDISKTKYDGFMQLFGPVLEV